MANEPRNTRIRGVTKPTHSLTLLDAQATTGAGTTFDLGGAFVNFGVVAYRATTGAAGGSTKPSYRLQGSLDNGTKWFTIGAATRTITTAVGTLSAVTSTAAITHIRASINNFTTSNSTAFLLDKVATTVIVAPYGV